MFGSKRDQIVNSLNKLDLNKLKENDVYALRLAFNQLFESQTGPSIDLKYAYDIVTNTNVVIFEWALDIDVPTIYVSDNISQFGYKPEDFYDGDLKDYWAFLHPEDLANIKDELYKAREAGETYVHAYRIITKSGEVRWVEERIIYERDENGLLTHEKGIVIDITEMKRLQEQVKLSEDKYRRIFQNSSVIILTMDTQGKITAINDMFSKTLGYTAAEVIHTNLKEYMVDGDVFDLIIENSNNINEESIDMIFVKKNKEEVVLNLSSNIIHDINEDIEIVAIDVSEKKKDEQRIRYLSYHDKLTDVYNRAYFDEMFQQLDVEKKYPFSIIIGDMNGLKELNDNYGHKSGDQILKHIAKIFKNSCREEDLVCRIGGDEFAIICPGSDAKGAEAVCERIRKNCLENVDHLMDSPSIALGFATKVDNTLSMDDLFKLADDQMYKNKMTFKKSTSGMYISALQMMLEKNSFETKAHTQRMQKMALTMGDSFGMSSNQLDDLNLVALMHDIGKIGIPNEILNKRGPLTEEEYQVVMGHSYIGYSILESVPATQNLAEYILYHHEKYDGSGYPEGLVGEAIPLISRIIHLIDAYDVMINGTIYKSKMSKEDVINEIKSLSGIQFDPELVKTFVDFIQ